MSVFSETPVSIGELRVARTEDARDWSPKEALVQLLRRIDAGEVAPDALVIAYRMKAPDGSICTDFSASSPDIHATLGLLEAAKQWAFMYNMMPERIADDR